MDNECTAADWFNLKFASLARYVKKVKVGNETSTLKSRSHNRQIFSIELEHLLVDYINACSLMSHGLTVKDTRKLAYRYAVANKIAVPDGWIIKELAGRDWLTNFLKRNDRLSIRQPEPTSQARASGFNFPVVSKFYDNLISVISEHNFTPNRIWNGDETNIPTVLNPRKVLAKKRSKTSATDDLT